MKTQTYTNIPNSVLMVLLTSGLNKPEIKLYLYLRMHKNNKNGTAWPSTRTIVREAHISNNDVKVARENLEKAGLIRSEARSGSSTLVYFQDDSELLATSAIECSPRKRAVGVRHVGDSGVRHSGDTTNTTTITNLSTTTNTSTKKRTGKKVIRKKEQASLETDIQEEVTDTKTDPFLEKNPENANVRLTSEPVGPVGPPPASKTKRVPPPQPREVIAYLQKQTGSLYQKIEQTWKQFPMLKRIEIEQLVQSHL